MTTRSSKANTSRGDRLGVSIHAGSIYESSICSGQARTRPQSDSSYSNLYTKPGTLARRLQKRLIFLMALALFVTTPALLTMRSRAASSGSEQDGATADVSSAQSKPQEPAEKFLHASNAMPGRYIVVLKQDAMGNPVKSRSDALIAKHGGIVKHVFQNAMQGFVVDQISEAAARRLSEDEQVAYVEEDGQMALATTQFNPPWGLDRIDQRDRPINGAYSFSNVNTGDGVHVYIIDTGIQTGETEFRKPNGGSRVVYDADFVNDGQFDCNGHGTLVASIAGGNTFGVAKGVTLHSIRVGGCENWVWNSNVVAGVDWVTAHHQSPAVVNMSLGGDPNSIFGGIDYGIEDAVRGSIAAGVTYVVAAGNSSSDCSVTSPARVAECITVAAEGNDGRSSFSNFGPLVDLFAPGAMIPCASNQDLNGNGVLDDQRVESGTSVAAPHVTGVAARFLQLHPDASPAAVQGAIKNSATRDKISDPGPGTPNLLLYSELHAAVAREGSVPFIAEAATSVDSGMDVGPNEWLALTGGGQIWAGVILTGNNGPEGWNKIEDSTAFPLAHSRPFSLLGIFDSSPFYIGGSNATGDPFTSVKRLFLRTNDDVPGNGSGGFNCQIQVWKNLPDVSADFVSQSVPTVFYPGQTASVSVTMKNTGPTTWPAGSGYGLGSQNPQDNMTWGIGRIAVPFDVAPGSLVTFAFNITAPTTPGTYNFQWRMLQEFVQWFGDMTANVPITVLAPSNQAMFVSQSVPSSMYVSEPYDVSITMKNTGTTTWQAGTNYRLGSQNPQDNQTWGWSRITLAGPVPPGGQVTFTFTVTAPKKSGTYNFQWRMVQDGVEWFGDFTTNVAVRVRPVCTTC
jgi:aqualysin 1